MAPPLQYCQKQSKQLLLHKIACSSTDSTISHNSNHSSSHSRDHSSSHSSDQGSSHSSDHSSSTGSVSSSRRDVNNSTLGQAVKPQTQSSLLKCKAHHRHENVLIMTKPHEVEGKEVAEGNPVEAEDSGQENMLVNKAETDV